MKVVRATSSKASASTVVPSRTFPGVAHQGGHAQPAPAGLVGEVGLGPARVVLDGEQRVLQRRGHAWIAAHHRRLLVGHELGLHDDARRSVEDLDRVIDAHDGPLHQRHQPRRAHPDRAAARRRPCGRAAQHARVKIEHALVVVEGAVAEVERLVVDQEAQDLAIGDVNDGLTRLRVAVARLGVRQRPRFVEPVEVRARQAKRLALVQVAPHPDVTVAEGEDRFGLGQSVQIETDLPHRPRLDGVHAVIAHCGSIFTAGPSSLRVHRHCGSIVTAGPAGRPGRPRPEWRRGRRGRRPDRAG